MASDLFVQARIWYRSQESWEAFESQKCFRSLLRPIMERVGESNTVFLTNLASKRKKGETETPSFAKVHTKTPKNLPIRFQLLMIPTTPSIDLGSIPSSYEPFVDAQDANHSKRESKIWYFGTFYHSAVGAHPIKHRRRMSPSGIIKVTEPHQELREPDEWKVCMEDMNNYHWIMWARIDSQQKTVPVIAYVWNH